MLENFSVLSAVGRAETLGGAITKILRILLKESFSHYPIKTTKTQLFKP